MDLESLRELLRQPLAVQAIGLSGLFLACAIVHLFTKHLLVRGVQKLALRSSTTWDDVLHSHQVFARLAALLPALVLWYGVRALPEVGEEIEVVVSRVAVSIILLVAVRAVFALLSAANEIYSRDPRNRDRPIKGYLQVVKIFVAIVTAVLVLATLMDRSPLLFLSGIGAMTAVLLLIFRDTILSLVASVQLTGNDMLRVGDWIEMPQLAADGDVIDIALHTVKVQNWDKTITSIPTHRLISESFKNWRGMERSGGRRIKRSISIDMSTVRFLTEEEIERFGAVALLHDYVHGKRDELTKWNAEDGRNPEVGADIRRLTNLGTFRAYIERYLRNHPRIHQHMTLIVRQLPPEPTGVPIELYCFTNITDWTAYEGIQADLFDHLLAIANEFGLGVFQSPGGRDLERLAPSVGAPAS